MSKRHFSIKTLGVKGVSGDWITDHNWAGSFEEAFELSSGLKWSEFKVEQYDFGYELSRENGKIKEKFYVSELDRDGDIIRTRKPAGLRTISGPVAKGSPPY